MEHLTVYKSPFTKIRIGQPHAGGYIIADIPDIKYDILLSGGIDTDILFEYDFVSKYNSLCYAYDGTIDSIDIHHSNITFIKKNINFYVDNLNTNLHDEINSYSSIFIKMNIEGGEYAWIESLRTEHLSKFEQIVIEFHHALSKSNIIKKINNTHYLIHFHGNNCCSTSTYQGIKLPDIFQCTYLHKKYFTTIELNTDNIPSILDTNDTIGPDIFINYPPFVNLISSDTITSDVPSDPITSDVPSEPITSDVSSEPITSDIPSEPITSDVPSDPITSDVSSEPITSDVPSEPITSDVPSEPITSDIPTEPITSDVSAEPITSDVPSEPITSDIPTDPNTSDVSSEPITSDIPSEPITSDIPSEPITSDIPSEPITSDVPSEPITSDVSSEPITSDVSSEPITSDVSSEPITSDVSSEPITSDIPSEPITSDVPTDTITSDGI